MSKWSWPCRMLIAIILTCLVWISSPQAVFAEISRIGPGLYMAGIPSEQFQYFAAPESIGRQRASNWCWAASIQMVLNYHGLYVTQEEVVARIFGNLADDPGQPEQILQALSGWAPDVRGRYSAIMADPYSITGPSLITDLAYRWPLIVGLDDQSYRHAYVLTAVIYGVDRENNPVFKSAVLRDPWPGSPSRKVMSWEEFMPQVVFAARVHVFRG